MDTPISPIPSQQDIQRLKEELESAKRHHEYNSLKNELDNIVRKAQGESLESLSVMQGPDTHQVFKTKRSTPNFFEQMISKIAKMLSPHAVIRYIIGLSIIIICLYLAKVVLPYHCPVYKESFRYLVFFAQIVGAFIIINSASRGLLLPTLAAIIGAFAIHTLTSPHQLLFGFNSYFYLALLIVGIVGLCISAMSMR